MWIKLISPEVTMRPMDSLWKKQMSPPLCLLVLSKLTPPEHQVTICDENVERLCLDDSPDLVGITVKVDTFNRSAEIATAYRRRGIPVVVGGIHATACPEECSRIADSVVVGEAETLWGTVVHDASGAQLAPRYQAAEAVPLELVPIPDWQRLNEDNYLFTNTLRVSRGCPWKCDFCYNSATNIESRHRVKPIGNVIREIESLGTRHVMFIDDNFIGNPKYAQELLRAMKPLGLTWHTAVSADIGNREDLMDLMADCGCKSLFIGFESVNSDNLRGCCKRQNKADSYNATIAKIHDRQMMVNASVVFGFDHDSRSVFKNTLEWLVANKVETMTGHILTPYPGTVFHRKLDVEGRIIDRNLDHYNTSRAVFRPKQMTAAELERGYLWTYKQFYSWENMIKRSPAYSTPRFLPYWQFGLLYRKYGKVLSLLGRFAGMRRLARMAKRVAYPEHSDRPVRDIPLVLPQATRESRKRALASH